MNNKITVEITEQYIKQNRTKTGKKIECPITNALEFSLDLIVTVGRTKTILRDYDKQSQTLSNTAELKDWITRFDRDEKVEPITVQLDLIRSIISILPDVGEGK